MKRALIPGLFVVCGALASIAWRTVELPCQLSKLEIASAAVSPLLRCAANELFTRDVAFSEVNSRGQLAEQHCGSRDSAPALLLEILLNHACDRFDGEIISVRVSISSWLDRHRV